MRIKPYHPYYINLDMISWAIIPRACYAKQQAETSRHNVSQIFVSGNPYIVEN